MQNFIKNISKNHKKVQENKIFIHSGPGAIPKVLESKGDMYLLITETFPVGPVKSAGGIVIEASNDMLKSAMFYNSIQLIFSRTNKKYNNHLNIVITDMKLP